MMAAVMSNGELQNFNRDYRRRRMEAAARRLRFPTYNAARRSPTGRHEVAERADPCRFRRAWNCQ
jgi:hypothetical protein